MAVAFAKCYAFCVMLSAFMLNVIMLDVTFVHVMLSRDYAECRSATRCYAECCISSAMF
jgi:hypothetical protein